VDWPAQQASPVVGEVAGNPRTTDGDQIMNALNEMTRNEKGPALLEVPTSELTEITGGTLWVSDGYCVSPFLPRHLPLAALPESITQIKEQSAIGSATGGAGAGR
jgi:hypothetical protein